MSGQSWIEATAEQRAELRGLAGSSEREEADRARAMLLSLEGWTSERIAAAFCAQPDSVRDCRWIFGREGARRVACPQAVRAGAGQSAGRLIGGRGGVGAGRIGSAELDLAAPASRDREANRAAHLEIAAQCGDAQKRGFAWRRPRHTLKGRQDAEAVERSGLRLRLLKQQAEAGEIVLLFGDESEALTHPYLAHAWAKRGCDLRVEAPGQSKKRAMIGSLDCAAHKLIASTSATKRSSDFITVLGRLDAIYGPCPGRPGRPDKPVVFVLDNGPIHTSKASQAALAARAWLTIEWLPKYRPELHDLG